MDTNLSAARREIAGEIGADIGYFTPPDQKRFTGIEAMLVIATPLLVGFFKGFLSKVGEKIGEKAGEPVGEFIANQLAGFFKQDSATQDKLLETAHAEALQHIRTAGLTPDEIKSIATAVSAEMTTALSQQAPEHVSDRISQKVRDEAVKTL